LSSKSFLLPEKVLHLDVDILISEIFKVDYSAFLCDMRKIKIPIIHFLIFSLIRDPKQKNTRKELGNEP